MTTKPAHAAQVNDENLDKSEFKDYKTVWQPCSPDIKQSRKFGALARGVFMSAVAMAI